jgi:hypothetical protein
MLWAREKRSGRIQIERRRVTEGRGNGEEPAGRPPSKMLAGILRYERQPRVTSGGERITNHSSRITARG